MKILFVDDNYDLRHAARIWLSQSERWQIEIASDGKEAFGIVQIFAPDVLITDNKMIEMDGPELIQRAKQINPAIKTILLSGLSNVHEIAKECGANASFKKPYEWNVILALIDSWEE